MRQITLLSIYLITSSFGFAQGLTIVEQDFDKARKIAEKENKLLFLDFYTTWCAPCKKLDKLIFQNDSLSKKLGKDFVLLRYDAEKDKEHHLSKKHHVNSYPTGIILTPEGFVINRKYGFPGEELPELSTSVFDFTNKSIQLNKKGKIIKGYSNKIKLTGYPQFYIDYINRDDIKVKTSKEFNEYWKNEKGKMSEEYFSTLIYFARDVPTTISDDFLKNKEKYIELYGEGDVNVALVFFSFGKFDDAIENKSQKKLDKAMEFVAKALSEDSANRIISLYKEKFKDVN